MTRLPLLLAALLPACVVAKVGDGQSATVVTRFGGVAGVELTTFVDTTVTVTPGVTEATVSLTCDDSLLDELEVELDGDVLVLSDSAGYALVPRSDCHAEIDVPGLSTVANTGSGLLAVTSPFTGLVELDATGSGGIEVAAATTCDLTITHTGSGPVTVSSLTACTVDATTTGSGGTHLTGSADTADLRVTGTGGFGEAGFVVDVLDLVLTGSGGAELTVLESATITLTGSGGAVIHGDPPERDVQDDGSGDVNFE